MSSDFDRNLVEHLTWDEVARRIDSDAAAIFPIGAGAKEHGFHLPMNTDRIQAEWLAVKYETSGRLAPSDASSPNYSRSGSYGDPTLATSAKGEVLLAAMVDDLAEQVIAFLAAKNKSDEMKHRSAST